MLERVSYKNDHGALRLLQIRAKHCEIAKRWIIREKTVLLTALPARLLRYTQLRTTCVLERRRVIVDVVGDFVATE